MLSCYQSGYRAKHSTKTVMLKVLDDIGIILDQGKPVLLVLLDFSKAFDTVSHSIMCRKLRQIYGFSFDAVNLIKSYLENRFQTVLNNGVFSKFLHTASGVPQGSILGPILFSLYINDLPSILKHCYVHIFADDVQVYIEHSDASVRKINEDLDSIFKWATKNKLSLNTNKSHAMFISTSNQRQMKPDIKLNNVSLKYVETAVTLGFNIKSNFEWDSVILSQCGKIYAKLRTLQLKAAFLKTEVKIKLFKSLILPYFIACDLWLMQSSAFAVQKMRVALNNCVRFVYGLGRMSHVSHLQHRLIGCSFDNFCKTRCCLFMFNLVNNKMPGYLFEKLSVFRGSRSKKFVIPRHRTAKYGGTFFVRGVAFWNSLPNDVTMIQPSGLVNFRRRIFEHFE